MKAGPVTEVHHFPAEKIRALLLEIKKKTPDPHYGAVEGWRKYQGDPSNILDAFEPLSIREGYVLRTYLLRAGGNGNGITWAMPASSPFPESDNCQVDEESFSSPPTPPEALDDFMLAIEGDNSPWSYFCASIFAREMREFGALWHGTSWGVCTVIAGDDPWSEPTLQEPNEMPISSLREKWEWTQKPNNFYPSVEMVDQIVKVRFVYFSLLCVESLCQVTDTYNLEELTFKTDEVLLASGPRGMIF